jgi:hypothetical protein
MYIQYLSISIYRSIHAHKSWHNLLLVTYINIRIKSRGSLYCQFKHYILIYPQFFTNVQLSLHDYITKLPNFSGFLSSLLSGFFFFVFQKVNLHYRDNIKRSYFNTLYYPPVLVYHWFQTHSHLCLLIRVEVPLIFKGYTSNECIGKFCSSIFLC